MSRINYSTLLNLANQLWQHDVPLLVCQTYGMLGYMRIQIKEHTSNCFYYSPLTLSVPYRCTPYVTLLVIDEQRTSTFQRISFNLGKRYWQAIKAHITKKKCSCPLTLQMAALGCVFLFFYCVVMIASVVSALSPQSLGCTLASASRLAN